MKKVTVSVDKKLNVSIEELKDSLQRQKLDKVDREGKELHFKFHKMLVLHLMLKDQLYIFEKKNEHKYSIIELAFTDDVKANS